MLFKLTNSLEAGNGVPVQEAPGQLLAMRKRGVFLLTFPQTYKYTATDRRNPLADTDEVQHS